VILPSDAECRRILDELEDEPALTTREAEFVESNAERQVFTDPQREVVAKFKEKYDV
jgi:hypothetical protein